MIDAVPFNIRYCVKHYGMERRRIADKFTILAQINLDGNCCLIMLIGTLIVALFLKADVLIPTAVYLEVFFGAIQNLINVTGDVVTVAIEEKHVWK